MSRVLVVIPTLERSSMCRRAVDSLLAQSFTEWNLVIAKNGGSAHVSAYAETLGKVLDDPRVRLLVLPGSGLGYALNEGIERYISSFSYFANLEDDDEWDSGFLEVMVSTLQLSGADVANCLQRQVPMKRQSNGGPMHPGAIRRHNWINFPMCLYRADLYHRVGGFSVDAGPATDWDFHLRALSVGAKYAFVDQVLMTHHWHSSNYCVVSQGEGLRFIRSQVAAGVYDLPTANTVDHWLSESSAVQVTRRSRRRARGG